MESGTHRLLNNKNFDMHKNVQIMLEEHINVGVNSLHVPYNCKNTVFVVF